MSEVAGGLEDYSDISGDQIAKYLETYAEKFHLLERCKLDTRVVKIDRDGESGPWKLFTQATNQPEAVAEELRCTNLILALGHEDVPKFPEELDTSKYTGTLFHARDLNKRHDEIVNDENIKDVTVVGGHKTAFEVASNMGFAGKKVNWLIREDGMGPGQLVMDRPDGKKHMAEGLSTRVVSFLAPSFYSPHRWITHFLYGGENWFGRWFSVWFWKTAYKKDYEKVSKPGLEAMKPMSDR